MKLLVSGGHRPMYDEYDVGHLICPRSRNIIWSREWAADNAAFSGFDADSWCAMLDAITGRSGCLFATVPDVVGDAKHTRVWWDNWKDRVYLAGLPAAYVLQDGSADVGVPWDECAALFVGGSTAYKVSAEAVLFIREAKRRGKWVHVGRVNTERRLRWAQHVGADSVDGSGFARFPDHMFPRYTRVAMHLPLPFTERQGA